MQKKPRKTGVFSILIAIIGIKMKIEQEENVMNPYRKYAFYCPKVSLIITFVLSAIVSSALCQSKEVGQSKELTEIESDSAQITFYLPLPMTKSDSHRGKVDFFLTTNGDFPTFNGLAEPGSMSAWEESTLAERVKESYQKVGLTNAEIVRSLKESVLPLPITVIKYTSGEPLMSWVAYFPIKDGYLVTTYIDRESNEIRAEQTARQIFTSSSYSQQNTSYESQGFISSYALIRVLVVLVIIVFFISYPRFAKANRD